MKEGSILGERYRLYVKNINTYLGISTEAVLRFGGVIDKYIGDAVMAAWGVPVVKEDRRSIARRAILAAVYANTLTTFTIKRMKEDGIDPIFIFEQRFVLHCGEVLAGIFGTPLRFGYTTMGAPVNETSRMEGLPEAHTGKVTISGPLNALIEDIAETEFVCSAKLKGKVDTIDVFHFKRFKVDDFPAFAREYMDDRESDIFPQNDFFEQYVMGEGGHVK